MFHLTNDCARASKTDDDTKNPGGQKRILSEHGIREELIH